MTARLGLVDALLGLAVGGVVGSLNLALLGWCDRQTIMVILSPARTLSRLLGGSAVSPAPLWVWCQLLILVLGTGLAFYWATASSRRERTPRGTGPWRGVVGGVLPWMSLVLLSALERPAFALGLAVVLIGILGGGINSLMAIMVFRGRWGMPLTCLGAASLMNAIVFWVVLDRVGNSFSVPMAWGVLAVTLVATVIWIRSWMSENGDGQNARAVGVPCP